MANIFKGLNALTKKMNVLLDKPVLLFLFAFGAIFVESFSSVFLKIAGRYTLLSIGWMWYFALAVGTMGVYAIMWQFLLEKLPLSSAYLRKGVSYILVFVWAVLIFHETITKTQLIGAVIIMIGIIVSHLEDRVHGDR